MVSVIIPAYNAEEYLEASINSILGSNAMDSIEIVVVDDGSTDGTETILARLSNENPSVKVIRQMNAGVSSARNRGISEASGDWITFVDADDTVFQAGFQSLLPILQHCSADFVVLKSMMSGQERYPWNQLFDNNQEHTPERILRKGYLRGSICGCVFKKSFIESHRILFPEGVTLAEDTIFYSECLSSAKSVLFCDIPFYNVSRRFGSASRNNNRDDIYALAKAIETARHLIPHDAIRNYTLFKLLIGITSRAVECQVKAKELEAIIPLNEFLPISLDGITTERGKIILLNRSYWAFYKLILLRNRILQKRQ